MVFRIYHLGPCAFKRRCQHGPISQSVSGSFSSCRSLCCSADTYDVSGGRMLVSAPSHASRIRSANTLHTSRQKSRSVRAAGLS